MPYGQSPGHPTSRRQRFIDEHLRTNDAVAAARGEARPDSDIDLMVDIDPKARIGLVQYAGIVNYLQDLFPGQVDVADREGLKELVRPNAERDAIYAS